MTEYDPNLPQEFGHMPKRRRGGLVLIVLALVAAFLLSALITMTRDQAAVTGSGASGQQQPGSTTATPLQGE